MNSRVQRVARNTQGRDLIVGDIHGCFSRLLAALKAVDFRPEHGDRLFSVGDLVDRGPESKDVLVWLAQPFFRAVRGNHEQLAISWAGGLLSARDYAGCGGGWNVRTSLDEQQRLSVAFQGLPIAMELETAGGLVGIVHADCPFADWGQFVRSLEDATLTPQMRDRLIDEALWSRERIERMGRAQVDGARAVVVGHTPVQRMTSLGNVLYIDTGGWLPVHQEGHFTLLNADTLQPERARVASNDPQRRAAA